MELQMLQMEQQMLKMVLQILPSVSERIVAEPGVLDMWRLYLDSVPYSTVGCVEFQCNMGNVV
jgi:hypothetical protein